jgi:beta-glucosidase
LEQSNSRDLQALSRKISLQQGHAYTLRAEYISTGRGLARIFWALSTGVDPPSLIKAVEAARSSDVAVVFAGAWAHERFDASTLALLPSQNQLIEAVAAVNPRTIVVLQSGTPVLMPWLSKVASVLEAWFPGEKGGTAIADVLSGDVNPSAKLPLTFPTSDDQVPASSANQYPGINSIEHYTEGLNVGYRWQDAQHKTPLFPFGFGLSNTRFKLSHLTYEILADHTSDVSVTAENRGPRAGAIVPQLYITYPTSAGEPPVQLRGFSKIYLRRETIQKVHFKLEARDFSIWSVASHRWDIVPGNIFWPSETLLVISRCRRQYRSNQSCNFRRVSAK